MGRDISIAITAKDNFSQAITTMRNANQSFNKDLTGLSTKLDELNKTKITIKVDADKAKTALREAEKQFAATGDAADKLNLELANASYENARRNLGLVSENARKAEKDIKNLAGEVSKSENRAGSGASAGSGSMLSTLGKAGLTQLLGGSLSNAANVFVSSAFGSDAGSIFGSILASTATGAALGSMVPIPVVGTVIGAGVGALAGGINAATDLQSKKDDAFRSVVQERYSTVTDEQSASISNGSAIAGNREQMQISFSTLLGGEDKARDYLSQMTEFANVTPFGYDDLASISKTMLAYKYNPEEILPMLTKVGDAGSALGMSTADMNYVATSLGRMKSTGKTTLEYLNPLLERGIDVWDYLSRASGKTRQEVQEMVSKGLYPGEKAAKAIADYMGQDFAGNMAKQAQTFEGLTSTLQDAQEQMDNAMGEGYNEERKKGLQAQIDFLGGENGARMEEANRAIGAWQASLEYAYEESIRNAQMKMMDSKEYKLAEETGNAVEMGKLLAEAKVQGMNEYYASDGYQLELQANLSLAESIKNDTGSNQAYWNSGRQMGLQFSEGLASVIDQTYVGPNPALFKVYVPGKGKAYGMNYVPYDNFPAMLHEGERVLTASENRNYQSGAGGVMVTGNNFTVREEADIEKIARALVVEFQKKRAVM